MSFDVETTLELCGEVTRTVLGTKVEGKHRVCNESQRRTDIGRYETVLEWN